jgi:hypothetical protein
MSRLRSVSAVVACLVTVVGTIALNAQVPHSVSAGGIGDHVASIITVTDPAQPSAAHPGVGYNDPRYQSPFGTGLDGVARLLMTNDQGFITAGCSGSLLWTGQDVLTAAHCVTDGSNVVTT